MALDDEGTPLASYAVQTSNGDLMNLSDVEKIGGSFLTVLLWILGGIAASGGIALAAYLIWKRRKSIQG